MERGVRAVGVDLSAAMIGVARRTQPGAEFREGDLLHLPAEDGEFAAAVALYSLIHLPPSEHVPAFVEMRRVLRPGAPLLVSFHEGSSTSHLEEWRGHAVDVDFHFFTVRGVCDALEEAGFAVEARLERGPCPQEAETRRAYLLARRS